MCGLSLVTNAVSLMRVSLGLSLVALVALSPDLPAGPYQPSWPTPFAVGPDGTAEPLSFDAEGGGQFRQLFGTRQNELDANPLRAENPDRDAVLARIADWELRRPTAASPAAVAGHAADLLRVGKSDAALNVLAPRSRDRSPDFRVLATLAHVYAARGEWADAVRWHQAAFLDAEFPDDLAGTAPEQRDWLKRVEREYYRRWLRVHRDRAAAGPSPADEPVFPLFDGVSFVNEAGEYEPGHLAAAERAKLPADAVAIVQQLLLWDPTDTALYWLLAELYAAEGRFRQAEIIFNECADGRRFANRGVFMAHRAAVRDAKAAMPAAPAEVAIDVPPIPAAAPPKATPADDPDPDYLPSRPKVIAVAAVFGVIALALIALQVRAVGRRLRGNCGPVG